MKKFFTLIALLFAVCSLEAQFTRADFPLVGDSEYYTGLDTAGVYEGAGGTGLTWDYSGATVNGTHLGVNYIAPTAHPQSSMIPGANLVVSQSDGGYVYLNVNNDSVVNVGEQALTGQPCSYPNLRPTLLRFPANINDAITDSIYGEYFDGFLTNVTRWGEVTTIVDADGTLLLPGGYNWSNVTRIFYQYVYRDSSWTGAAISDVYLYRFEYYAAGRTTPVMIFNTRLVSVNAGPFTEERKIWYADTTAVGIDEPVSIRGLEVSPNPVEDQSRISYQLDESQQVNVSLFNVLGKRVLEVYTGMQEAGSQQLKLDASNLSPGIYFVRLQAGHELLNRKLVIR